MTQNKKMVAGDSLRKAGLESQGMCRSTRLGRARDRYKYAMMSYAKTEYSYIDSMYNREVIKPRDLQKKNRRLCSGLELNVRSRWWPLANNEWRRKKGKD